MSKEYKPTMVKITVEGKTVPPDLELLNDPNIEHVDVNNLFPKTGPIILDDYLTYDEKNKAAEGFAWGGLIERSHKENGITVIDKVNFSHVSVTIPREKGK